MNKLFTAAAAASILAVFGVSTVSAADIAFDGSVRFGATLSDPDKAGKEAAWDWGAGGFDGADTVASRVGLTVSNELGNGAAAGAYLNAGLSGDPATDDVYLRYANAWVSGGWGKLTLGQQDNPLRSAALWDQTRYLGGAFRFGDGGPRGEGIRYDMSSGPFNLAFMGTADGAESSASTSNEPALFDEQYSLLFLNAPGSGTSVSTKEQEELFAYADFNRKISYQVENDSAVDSWTIAVGYDFGIVKLNVSHRINNGGYEASFGDSNYDKIFVDNTDPRITLTEQHYNGKHYIDDSPDFSPTFGAALTAYMDATEDVAEADTEAEKAAAYTAQATALTALNTQRTSVLRTAGGVTPPTTRPDAPTGANAAYYAVLDAEAAANAARDADATTAIIQNYDAAGRTSDNTAIGVSGKAGPVDWYIAYQMSADNAGGDGALVNDVTTIGGFVSFDISANDKVYLYYATHSADRVAYAADGTEASGESPSETLVGYSHNFGGGVNFDGEYRIKDTDTETGGSPTTLALALRVNF